MATKKVELVISAKDQASGVLQGVGGTLATVAKGVTVGLAAVAAAATAVGVTAVKSAAQLEQQKVAFKTLLGSAEAAEKALNRIKKDAKTTPFELPGLIDMNKRLISAGLAADKAADLVLDLGDAVSATGGTAVEMDRLITNFQNIQAVGKASLQDIRQFGNAGIPIFDLLADSMGKSKEQIADMVSEGKIGFSELEAAFRDASDEGGRFFNAMEDQSRTLNGIISNIKDSIGIALTEFAEQTGLFDAAKIAAEDLRATLERMTPEVIRGVTELGATIRAFIQDPKTQAIIERLRSAFERLGQILTQVGDGIEEMVLNNWEKVAKLWNEHVLPALEGLRAAFDSMKKKLDEQGIAWEAIGKIIGTIIIGDLMILIGLATAFILVITKVVERIQYWIIWLRSVSDTIRIVIEWVRELPSTISVAIETAKQKFADWKSSMVEFFNNLPTQLLEALGMMMGYIVQFVIMAPTKFAQMFIALKDRIGEVKERFKEFLFVELPQMIGIGGQKSTVSAKEGFANLVKSVKEKLIELKDYFLTDFPNDVHNGIQKIVGFFLNLPSKIKSALNSLIGSFEGVLQAIADGYNKVASKTPGMESIPKISLARLSQGAHSFSGGMALVGERGPELVTLPKGSSIFTAETSARAGGGGGVTVNFNGDVSLDSESRVDQLVRQIELRLGSNANLELRGV